MKKVWLITACCLTLSSLAFSQAKQGRTKLAIIHGAPTTCPNDPVLPPDGIVTGEDLLLRGTTAFYSLNAKGGHSYSIEVWDPFDSTANVAPVVLVGTACNSNDIHPDNVTSVDPDLSGGFSHRVSWVQGSDQILQIAVGNPDLNNDYAYYIRVTDTSLHNIHWSTISNFDTQWTLTNITAADITGTLMVVSEDGTTLASLPITLPADRFTQISARGSLVPANRQGAAKFVYVGPAGAVRGDTTIIKNDTSVIVQSSFVSQHSTY
jgi:hypothetical protein